MKTTRRAYPTMITALFLGLALLTTQLSAELIIPEKHELSQREYRRFILDNELKVLLVHDPDMNKSAVAMDVGIGSLADPRQHQGLAHFLEHMLFLGTQKYPEEGEFGRYLRSRGGYFNAYTAGDHTNYHFQIHHDALEGAIDRFAQFFTTPLFSPEFSSREIQAVHNEHKKNLLTDGWRQYHLLNTFFDPEHPARHFSTGNEETLKHVDPSVLKSFYESHYSANRMALVMLSSKPLDWMEAEVKKQFDGIVNRKLEAMVYPEQYLPPKETFRFIEVKPVKDLRELNFHFPLPALDPHFLSQPAGLLGYILGHEGKGSLLSALKKENLATGLSAGPYASTPNYGSFNIKVSLTPEGLEKVKRVTELCFAAFKKVQQENLPQHIFEEVKTKQQLEKVFSHRGEGTGRASELATNLNRYPMEWAENLKYSLVEKDDAIYKAIAEKLTPDNCIAMLSSQEVETDRLEPIYGTEYRYTEDAAWYAELKKVEPSEQIHLPLENPFFPSSAKVLPEQPVLILDEPSIKLYYLQDTEFRRPKASLIYRLRPEASSANLTRSVALDLAVACINEQLNEMAYPALLAGARFQLSRDDRGFVMRLSGYDRSLEKLLLKSLDGMTKLSLNQERFDAIVDRMVRSWNNFSKESAHKQARLIARSIRREIAFSPQNKAKIAETLSRSDVEATIANMWSRLNIEALAHGNLTAAEATSITQRLRRELMVTGLKKEDVFVHKTLTWPEPEQLVVRDELDTNNACYRLDLWLGLDNPFLRIASRVMDNFVSQPFYVEMRTRQQLGYIVGSATYRDEDQHYLVFIIQSGTHNAQQLAERCRTYIPNLTQALQELSAEEFSALKEAVKKELQEKPKSISAKASILFNLAFNENGNFDLNEELLTQLELLTQKKLITLLTKALSAKFERSFALELFAKGAEPALLGGGLENIQTFKSKRVYKAAP